jgi:hypothetical protein
MDGDWFLLLESNVKPEESESARRMRRKGIWLHRVARLYLPTFLRSCRGHVL